MPEKFTFPTIDQAMSLQSASNMQFVKNTLRKWFNLNNNLKLSQNVAWSFKVQESQTILRRYIHCKFCQAKLVYVQTNQIPSNKLKEDKQLSLWKLVKFYLHHDHRDIQSVRQKGKRKTFPHIYTKPQFDHFSVQKQRKIRKQKLRKRRYELNKFKKLQLYYRLCSQIKQNQKKAFNIKAFAAKTLGITVQRFSAFLNSNTRGVIQVSAIKQLLKRVGFQKYNIEVDNEGKVKYNKSKQIQEQNQNEINSQDQENVGGKSKQKSQSKIFEELLQFFKQFMIFVNHNDNSKNILEKSQGLINVTHIPNAITSKKYMNKKKWDALIMYSHQSNCIPNQLYALIMIDSEQFNIKQIKRAFEITFKLLNPLKKVQIKCCIHQQNIYIMGALDMIIEELSVKQKSLAKEKTKQLTENKSTYQYLSYFLSPQLSTQIIKKCQFIPKIFRDSMIDKIYELDGKQVDALFKKIIQELQKASKIKQFKVRTDEYLAQLKQFYENSHKIFLGKFHNPSFISLIFFDSKRQKAQSILNVHDQLNKGFQKYSQGQKHFLQFLLMIFQIFQLPGGSFIYRKHEGQSRQPTKLQKNYGRYLMLQDYNYIDEIKIFYNKHALHGKYSKSKTQSLKQNADFFEEFTALLYERVYKFKQIFMKLTPQVMAVLIKQIQKSFTLQIQTRTIKQIKEEGSVKAKQTNKPPFTIKILNKAKFWPTQSQKEKIITFQTLKNPTQTPTNLIQLEESCVQISQSQKQSTQGSKNIINKLSEQVKQIKKLWQCDCKYSRFTFLPCSHEIRCCLTFFTSIQDQVEDFWLFDPKSLQSLNEQEQKIDSDCDSQQKLNQTQDREGQNNSQSD